MSDSERPLDKRSDEELKSSLRKGDFGARRAAFAQEILRRREEVKAGRRSRIYLWVGVVFAAFSFGLASLTRFWRK